MFLDAKSRRVILEMVPNAFRLEVEALMAGPLAPLLGATERKLLIELQKLKKLPDAADALLRHQFWQEYVRAIDTRKTLKPEMNFSLVVQRVISKEAFYHYYIKDHHKLAYLLCPPVELPAIMGHAVRNIAFALEEAAIKGLEENPLEFASTALRIFESLSKKAQALGVDVGASLGRGQKHPTEEEPEEEEDLPPPEPEKTEEEILAEIEEAKKKLAIVPTLPEAPGGGDL